MGGEVDDFGDFKDPQTLSRPNIDLLRHMALNSFRYYKQRFGPKYGRMVLCYDNKHYWRKDVFPHYKFHRKKDRENSPWDWHEIFDSLDMIKDEMRQYMPYQVLDVAQCEADDIIGVVAKKNHLAEKILILSGDKDFGQLQKFKNIDQYAPIQKVFIKVKDPQFDLNMQIMRGDRGDGIPNFLSPDDTFFKEVRQKTLPRINILEQWARLTPDRFCTTEMLRGWTRNQTLIDLDKIPEKIQKEILKTYNEEYDMSNGRMMDYFFKKGLSKLLSDISQFKVNQDGC
jgi:5'-3' exonuclease